MDAFESHLKKLKFQDPPADLKARCLQGLLPESSIASDEAPSRVPSNGLLSWMWPHPKAWAGMAAVWMLCLGMHHWTPSMSQGLASSREMAVASPDRLKDITAFRYALIWVIEDSPGSQMDPSSVPGSPHQKEEGSPGAFLQRMRRIPMLPC